MPGLILQLDGIVMRMNKWKFVHASFKAPQHAKLPLNSHLPKAAVAKVVAHGVTENAKWPHPSFRAAAFPNMTHLRQCETKVRSWQVRKRSQSVATAESVLFSQEAAVQHQSWSCVLVQQASTIRIAVIKAALILEPMNLEKPWKTWIWIKLQCHKIKWILCRSVMDCSPVCRWVCAWLCQQWWNNPSPQGTHNSSADHKLESRTTHLSHYRCWWSQNMNCPTWKLQLKICPVDIHNYSPVSKKS